MLVTPLGIMMEVMEEQFWKAKSPINLVLSLMLYEPEIDVFASIRQ